MTLKGGAHTDAVLQGSVNTDAVLQGSANTDAVLQGGAETNRVMQGTLSGLSFVHGYSAYEIAVIHGFRGTAEEWLASLNGEPGKDGKDGVNGKDGAPGKDGVDGYAPVRGTDYWTEADKAEIKSYVDSAILGGEW